MNKYCRFVRIEHTLFSLPLIYSGVILASLDRLPPLRLLLLVLVAATGARTAAFALNRIIDREIDRRNPRTAGRELPSGRMTIPQASAVLAVGAVAYLVAAWAIAPICLALAPIPLAVFTVYPYMKRFTAAAHLGVGLALAMGPLGGWFAVSLGSDRPLPVLLLFFFTLFWVAGFDIIYATQDEASDRREGLHSIPVALGGRGAIRLSGLLHLLAFICLATLYGVAFPGIPALPLLLLAGLLLYLEHRLAADVELAFFRINSVVGFIVLAMVCAGAVGT